MFSNASQNDVLEAVAAGQRCIALQTEGKKIVGGAGNNDKAYASFLKTPTLVKFGIIHFWKHES